MPRQNFIRVKNRATHRREPGFAVVAFPAQYRVSGVKTFLVNQDGGVYERDLGPMTTTAARARLRLAHAP